MATVIMGIAVAGLIAGLSQSVRNASRLGDYDRAAMLARTKMNDLLLDANLPFMGTVSGEFDSDESSGMQSGGVKSGWRAALRPFEARVNAAPGSVIVQEVALEIWWQPLSGTRRTIELAGYRSAKIPLPPRP